MSAGRDAEGPALLTRYLKLGALLRRLEEVRFGPRGEGRRLRFVREARREQRAADVALYRHVRDLGEPVRIGGSEAAIDLEGNLVVRRRERRRTA